MSVESGPPSDDMKAASAAALGAAALKAQVLALREEREMEKLVLKVIELQIQKIQLKMANFANLEKLLDEEQKKVCAVEGYRKARISGQGQWRIEGGEEKEGSVAC